jgi:hypothetical protein
MNQAKNSTGSLCLRKENLRSLATLERRERKADEAQLISASPDHLQQLVRRNLIKSERS